MKQLLLFVVISTSFGLFAQNDNVGINTSTPDPSAILHLEANDKGLLVPRLTTTERDAIATPATGLIIYNTDEDQEEIYNGTCWIPSYLEECDDCMIDINFQQTTYTMDRNNSMALSIPVDIVQTAVSGVSLPMNLGMVHTFTEETEITLSQYAITGSTSITIDVSTNVFENGGDHFITLFGVCGNKPFAETILVHINPCDLVTINSDQTDYDLTSSGVTGTNCIVVTIEPNVAIRASDNILPAFTTGSIPANCQMGIINEGYVFGHGGDGPLLMTQNAEDGGTAFDVSCNVEFRNRGMIYGGGGAGTTVGAFQPIDLGPFTICVAIGAGGGGGMPDGLGGGDNQGSCSIVLGIWEDGNDAATYYDDNEGFAVDKSVSTPFSLGPVQGVFAVAANGGGGGDFGEPGTMSSQPVDFSGTYLEICINIPFIGNVCIPVPGLSAALNSLSNYIYNIYINATPGAAGYAIKYNGGAVTVPDGWYQSYQIRGVVGN